MDTHLSPREEVGDKGASLSKRLDAALNAYPASLGAVEGLPGPFLVSAPAPRGASRRPLNYSSPDAKLTCAAHVG